MWSVASVTFCERLAFVWHVGSDSEKKNTANLWTTFPVDCLSFLKNEQGFFYCITSKHCSSDFSFCWVRKWPLPITLSSGLYNSLYYCTSRDTYILVHTYIHTYIHTYTQLYILVLNSKLNSNIDKKNFQGNIHMLQILVCFIVFILFPSHPIVVSYLLSHVSMLTVQCLF